MIQFTTKELELLKISFFNASISQELVNALFNGVSVITEDKLLVNGGIGNFINSTETKYVSIACQKLYSHTLKVDEFLSSAFFLKSFRGVFTNTYRNFIFNFKF